MHVIPVNLSYQDLAFNDLFEQVGEKHSHKTICHKNGCF